VIGFAVALYAWLTPLTGVTDTLGALGVSIACAVLAVLSFMLRGVDFEKREVVKIRNRYDASVPTVVGAVERQKPVFVEDARFLRNVSKPITILLRHDGFLYTAQIKLISAKRFASGAKK
jgi:hypothetical protein